MSEPSRLSQGAFAAIRGVAWALAIVVTLTYTAAVGLGISDALQSVKEVRLHTPHDVTLQSCMAAAVITAYLLACWSRPSWSRWACVAGVMVIQATFIFYAQYDIGRVTVHQYDWVDALFMLMIALTNIVPLLYFLVTSKRQPVLA